MQRPRCKNARCTFLAHSTLKEFDGFCCSLCKFDAEKAGKTTKELKHGVRCQKDEAPAPAAEAPASSASSSSSCSSSPEEPAGPAVEPQQDYELGMLASLAARGDGSAMVWTPHNEGYMVSRIGFDNRWPHDRYHEAYGPARAVERHEETQSQVDEVSAQAGDQRQAEVDNAWWQRQEQQHKQQEKWSGDSNTWQQDRRGGNSSWRNGRGNAWWPRGGKQQWQHGADNAKDWHGSKGWQEGGSKRRRTQSSGEEWRWQQGAGQAGGKHAADRGGHGKFVVGSRVKIVNVSAHKAFNGKLGTVIDVHTAAGRYTVELDEDEDFRKGVKLKHIGSTYLRLLVDEKRGHADELRRDTEAGGRSSQALPPSGAAVAAASESEDDDRWGDWTAEGYVDTSAVEAAPEEEEERATDRWRYRDQSENAANEDDSHSRRQTWAAEEKRHARRSEKWFSSGAAQSPAADDYSRDWSRRAGSSVQAAEAAKAAKPRGETTGRGEAKAMPAVKAQDKRRSAEKPRKGSSSVPAARKTSSSTAQQAQQRARKSETTTREEHMPAAPPRSSREERQQDQRTKPAGGRQDGRTPPAAEAEAGTAKCAVQ
eukprot:TRINITY_DN26127_c0_g1_i1.p1 TRINITY_DN26127_c0_g1~~TRINITY_DN26127_c0_g1_i1.p1  ORF type:complete len:595 (-),score=169.19 TRINITY_DN26127_c0_g1_i1:285-2069(-)